MILEIDYGNTRLKWRLLSSDALVCVARGAVKELRELIPSLQDAGCVSIKFCRACSVRSCVDNDSLALLISGTYGVTIEYAQSAVSLGSVVNGYIDASKLGVDRWLAIVAAYTRIKGACLVIDCGTAITVDYVSACGVHMGGCIAPGFQQMAGMLKSSTQLRVDVSSVRSAAHACLAKDTKAAVYSGVSTMVLGFIKEQLLCAQAQWGASFAVVCAGGDSRFVRDVVPDAVIAEDLVFAGLAIACPYVG